MEKIIIRDLVDDEIYPKATSELKIRETVRVLLFNDKNEIALLHIKGEDRFGLRNHFETPGGGVDENESYEETVHREIKEELGYIVDDINYIGTISIKYNLLNRIDVGNFFKAKIVSKCDTSLEEYEKTLFKGVEFVSIDNIEEFYANHKAITVGNMIHTRDLAVIKFYKNKRKNIE